MPDGQGVEAELVAELGELERQILPLRERRTKLLRQLSAIRAGKASAAGRQTAVAERHQAVIDEAKSLQRLAWREIPFDWQKRMAKSHGLSTSSIRKILKRAGINVER